MRDDGGGVVGFDERLHAGGDVRQRHLHGTRGGAARGIIYVGEDGRVRDNHRNHDHSMGNNLRDIKHTHNE